MNAMLIDFLKALVALMPLITAIVSFLLAGLVGNFLVQKWQQRNWLEQQWLIQAEKQIDDLKSLSNELIKQGDSRSYKSRRLLLNLQNIKPSELENSQYLEDYKKSVILWNDSLVAFYTRLTLYASYRHRERLETNIQPRFYNISQRLDVLVKVRLLNGTVPIHERKALNEELDRVNASLGNFYRELLSLLLRKQKETYTGRKIDFTPQTIEMFSTWYLLKSLFESRHLPLTVFGPPDDLGKPLFVRM